MAGKEGVAGVPAPDRCQVVIHVDRDLTSDEGTLGATLEDGTHVSAETLRRVACDGGVVAAVVDEQGAVLDIGRRTRAIPTAIRRALWIRDPGVPVPGVLQQAICPRAPHRPLAAWRPDFSGQPGDALFVSSPPSS
jgi:hypothetical protein